jgi:hypothetical protein
MLLRPSIRVVTTNMSAEALTEVQRKDYVQSLLMTPSSVSSRLRRFIRSRAEYHGELAERWNRLYELLVREDRFAACSTHVSVPPDLSEVATMQRHAKKF